MVRREAASRMFSRPQNVRPFRTDAGRGGLGWAWLAALGVHLALPAAAGLAPGRAIRALVSSRHVELDLVDVDVAAWPKPEEPTPLGEPLAGEAAVPVRTPSIAAAGAGLTHVDGAAGEAAPTASGEPAALPAPVASAGGDEYGAPADAAPMGGSGVVRGGPVWGVPGAVEGPGRSAPAPTTAGAPRQVDRDIAGQVLRDTQRARDKAIGIDLPAAGTVASAVVAAVHGNDTPAFGRATFAIQLGPKGEVLGVALVSNSAGSPAGWQRALQAAAAKLSKQKLAMTGSFASGATVYVDVESVVQLPDGTSLRDDGKKGVRPGPPPGTVGGGSTFDLSNIGAHGSRVVKSRFRVVPAR